MSASPSPRKVVIVGGGFGGLAAGRSLARARNMDVTIIDRRNHHLFQPLLYQVATATLSPAEIAAPIRSTFSKSPNVSVILDTVTGFDVSAKRVLCERISLPFDQLIVATGAGHSYFGHSEWEPFAPGLKTIEQATEIRRRILIAFERAEVEENPERRRQHQTFVIVGGGPTGVELAGAIAEIARHTLSRDFRRIDPSRTRVILIEAGPRVLPSFAEDLSRHVLKDLESLGVQVWTSTSVTQVEDGGVRLGDEIVRASTVLWAAGVKPSPLGRALGAPLDRGGRVIVEPDLSIPGFSDVFVIGDLAHFAHGLPGPLPGLAPVAMQQGRFVARVIATGQRTAFRYRDKGQMATVGRRKAVAQTGQFRFTGLIAWLAWLFIHVYYLIGFRNRIFVMAQWAWAYMSFQRGARLIVDRDWQNKEA